MKKGGLRSPSIPGCDPGRSGSPRRSAGAALMGSGMPKARVLAVDDQRYFRELIEGVLTGEGYEVRTVSGGEEALHVLEREDFDVIVTDLMMPGVDGSELLRTVKERRPEQEVIIVSGVVDVKSAVEAMTQGAADYILKPFDRRTVKHAIEGVLQRRRLRDEHSRLVAENLEYMEVLALYERAVGLFSTLSIEPLAERLVEGVCLETRAQGGVLWVVKSQGDSHLELVGVRGLIRVEEESVELAVNQLGPAFAPLLEEGLSILQPWERGESGSTALYLPLQAAGELVGILRLSDKLEGAEFDERDRAAGEKFARLGAIAVWNALRFRSLERRSFRDPTTKAYTHAYFEDAVRNEIQKANRFGHHFSIVRVDVGAIGELGRETTQSQLARWLEDVVHHVGQALRTADLLAVESETRFCVLLPETDTLGSAVLKHRICEIIRGSGVLDDLESGRAAELTLAAATYPTDGTQLEALDRVLDRRLQAHRDSLVQRLDLEGKTFKQSVDALIDQAEPARPELPGQITEFLLEEVQRRRADRGLLVVQPGAGLLPLVKEHLARLSGSEIETDIVVLCDTDEDGVSGAPATWVPSGSAGGERPFLLYYGEGPAYALVTQEQQQDAWLPLFHSDDRRLVEHLAFQLQRDLGIPLGL